MAQPAQIPQTIDDLIPQERERLNKLMEDISTRRTALDAEETSVKGLLRAIQAYEDAKAGKTTEAPTKKATRAPREPKEDSKRKMILDYLKEPLTRGELIEKMSIKGNKPKEQSLSNLLGNLKKAGTIAQKDGKYIAA